ncbi:MAG: replication-associated recombination protein A, partial [Actinomycetota bacterium]
MNDPQLFGHGAGADAGASAATDAAAGADRGAPGRVPSAMPLAARLRPHHLDEYVGQSDTLGEGKPLRAMLDRGELRSLLLWGPPG